MSKNIPCICLIGPGGCGKDTAAEMLSKASGWPYLGSTSWYMKGHVAKALGVCDMSAWENRRLHRQPWRDTIDAYRANDPARVVKELLGASEGQGGIITGIRPLEELEASRAFLDAVIWVERPGIERDTTLTITEQHCPYFLRNDGTLADLAKRVNLLAYRLQSDLQTAPYEKAELTHEDFEKLVWRGQQ